MKLVIEGCAIATVDAAGTEHADGHIVIEDGRIAAVGEGADGRARARASTAAACSPRRASSTATTTSTSGPRAGSSQQATLFEWLQELYPVWARVDGEIERAAARAGLAALARSGCSTSTDHHYVFPRGAGDLLAIEVEAARELHVRFHPCRGSMDLGRSQGGLPPDEVTEDRDAILTACAEAIDRFHDPAPDAMVRVALAPCSPFSVTKELMAETAEFARQRGRAPAHAHGRDARRGAVLPRAVRRAPGRVPRAGRLARRRRLARPLRAPGRARGAPLRRDRHRRRALPVLERAARRRHRAGGGAHRGGRAGRPRRRRRRLQRGGRAGRRAARGAARRAHQGRPAGADRPRGARARHHPRRPLPRPRGRDRLARAGQAGRRRALAARRPRPRGHRRPGRRARARRRARSSTRCWSAAGPSSRTAG